VHFAAGIDSRPLPFSCVDFSAYFDREGEAGAVAEREACVPSDRSQISRDPSLGFGEGLDTGQRADKSVNPRRHGQFEVGELGINLDQVDGTHYTTVHDVVYEGFILKNRKDD
jgi:hypothetical protein